MVSSDVNPSTILCSFTVDVNPLLMELNHRLSIPHHYHQPCREREKRTSKINVDRRSTSNNYDKKFGTRSMEKQRGMAFSSGRQ